MTERDEIPTIELVTKVYNNQEVTIEERGKPPCTPSSCAPNLPCYPNVHCRPFNCLPALSPCMPDCAPAIPCAPFKPPKLNHLRSDNC